MADLAIGISKTVLEALVTKVKDAIKEEAEKLQIVQRDFVFIKDEFEVMQSFLNSDHFVKGVTHKVLKTWVRQVRDLSYDVEDGIEFVLHLDTKRSSWWLRLLPSCKAGSALPLDEVVAEIKLLKARVEEVSQRSIRYNFMTGSSTEMPPSTLSSTETSAASTTALDIFVKPKEDLKSQKNIVDLSSLIITEAEGLQVISIWGTGGGLGTISVIKEMYDSPKIRQSFGFLQWVKLLSFVDKAKNFVVQQDTEVDKKVEEEEKKGGGEEGNYDYEEDDDEEEEDDEEKDADEVEEILTQKFSKSSPTYAGRRRFAHLSPKSPKSSPTYTAGRFALDEKGWLIILEDLSSMEELDTIKSYLLARPNTPTRIRIVVSTKLAELASLCPEKPCKVSLIQKFSTHHSVYAFSKKPKEESSNSEALKDEARIAISLGKTPRNRAKTDTLSIFGRESEVGKLMKQIKLARSSEAHNVVSVCGVAGVGKSFLVKAIYTYFKEEDASSKKEEDAFKNYAWIDAPNPVNIMDFCRLLCSKSISEHESEFLERCWKLLHDNACLVVIDELRSIEDWDVIKSNLISRTSKSCIVVISREESIARYCATTEDAIFTIKGLEFDEAFNLFKQVLKTEKRTLDTTTMEEAKDIIKGCGGLPKLIEALGLYFVSGQNVAREMRRLKSNFLYELKTSNALESMRDVLQWVHSTFRSCPQQLKKCIFYLSLFTQSTIIRRRRLVMRWIAEGYSEGTDSYGMVEYTEELVNKLAALGMIGQPPNTPAMDRSDKRMSSCQVNFLFLEYIISQEMEEATFLPLEVTVLQGECNLDTQHIGQHLAIGSSGNRDKFVFDSFDFSRLRSLTVSREWRSFFLCHRMRVLRVLDLEGTNVKDEDVQQMVEQLLRLKFLSLRGCTRVSRLPDSLGELNQLQTLDIRHTCIVKVPATIIKLRKLLYIRAGTSVALMDDEPISTQRRNQYEHVVNARDGVKVPRGTGDGLMALHIVGIINVSTSGSAILQEFKNLTQVRKLGVSGINRRNVKGFFSAIVRHSHLESLSLRLRMDKDLDWLSKITPPRNLQRLKLYVHIESFEHWSFLQVLGQLPRLRTLRLCFKTGEDVELQFSDRVHGAAASTPGQFCELKVLEIACNSNLHLKFAEREMEKLELLKVRCLDGSSLKFSGIEKPCSLKHVCVKGSFDDAVKAELRQRVARNKNTPTFDHLI